MTSAGIDATPWHRQAVGSHWAGGVKARETLWITQHAFTDSLPSAMQHASSTASIATARACMHTTQLKALQSGGHYFVVGLHSPSAGSGRAYSSYINTIRSSTYGRLLIALDEQKDVGVE